MCIWSSQSLLLEVPEQGDPVYVDGFVNITTFEAEDEVLL